MYCFTSCTVHLCCCGKDKGQFTVVVLKWFLIFVCQAFSKKCAEQRKEWLTSWMEDTKRRRELGLPEQYLYEKDTKAVNYSDFVNKELVLFSNCDNERSIPSMVDGLKPGQRKVLYSSTVQVWQCWQCAASPIVGCCWWCVSCRTPSSSKLCAVLFMYLFIF